MAPISIAEIDAARARIANLVYRTPIVPWAGPSLASLTPGTRIFVKLELLQRTGTFKARGALMNLLSLGEADRQRGVTAVSAGNHAVATAFAARELGTSARVVMLASANRCRVELCQGYGADIVFADDVHEAFATAEQISQEEQRYFVHPFNGEQTVLGTATLGREIALEVPDADAVIIPVGGGGLCAGVAAAIKLTNPSCAVYGVEPAGADSLLRSRREGRPVTLESVNTIADSLGAPMALPYSFELCNRFVDDFVTVSDAELVGAMRLIFADMKMAVEPACAASTAALIGPLRSRLAGKRVVAIFCGSNIDFDSFTRLIGQ